MPDLLQYGRSDKQVIQGPMWTYHARMMVGLMDALGVERADFVCNSWGGTIALCLAAHYPDRVRSLVITGSMPVFYGPLRSEEHTSELQSLMRNSYAVFCLTKTK